MHGREADVVAVGSDTPGAQALGRAVAAGVPTAAFPVAEHADREARDLAMAAWLAESGAELVVLAGYMQLLSPAFLAVFPQRVINVHPALLPAFPGVRAVEQALDYGVKVFGVTVHFVDEGIDSGPVILQRAVELPDVTEAAAVRDALRPIEHELLTERGPPDRARGGPPGPGASAPDARGRRVSVHSRYLRRLDGGDRPAR